MANNQKQKIVLFIMKVISGAIGFPFMLMGIFYQIMKSSFQVGIYFFSEVEKEFYK